MVRRALYSRAVGQLVDEVVVPGFCQNNNVWCGTVEEIYDFGRFVQYVVYIDGAFFNTLVLYLCGYNLIRSIDLRSGLFIQLMS
jgi:hypothetical protein